MSTIETTSADMIRTRVIELLNRWDISYLADGGYKTTKTERGQKPWDCYEWRITFKRVGAKVAEFSTSYYCGLGHVTKAKSVYLEPKPIKPIAADVLYSLLSDAMAADQNFSEWCSDLDYSDDSISALHIYQACLDIGEKLATVFTREQMDELRDLLQDY